MLVEWDEEEGLFDEGAQDMGTSVAGDAWTRIDEPSGDIWVRREEP